MSAVDVDSCWMLMMNIVKELHGSVYTSQEHLLETQTPTEPFSFEKLWLKRTTFNQKKERLQTAGEKSVNVIYHPHMKMTNELVFLFSLEKLLQQKYFGIFFFLSWASAFITRQLSRWIMWAVQRASWSLRVLTFQQLVSEQFTTPIAPINLNGMSLKWQISRV